MIRPLGERWMRGTAATARLRVLEGVVASSAVVATVIVTAGAAQLAGPAQTVVATRITLTSATTVAAGAGVAVALVGVPAPATSATIAVDAESAEHATAVSVCPGGAVTSECTAHPVLLVPVARAIYGEAAVDLAGAGNEVTVYSSASAVTVTVWLTSYTLPTASATPLPTIVSLTGGVSASSGPTSDASGLASPTGGARSSDSSPSASTSSGGTPTRQLGGSSQQRTTTASSPAPPVSSSTPAAPSLPPAPVSPSPPPAGDQAHWAPLQVKSPAGRPGPSNTGVPAGEALTVLEGDLTITTPGTHIDRMEIHGYVIVKAPGVVISNSRVVGPATAPSTTKGLIQATDPAAGITVTDSEIFAQVHSPNVNGVMGHTMTLTRVNIHDVIDSVHITGGDVTIQDSWLHDNLYYAQDPGWGGKPSHNDSVQIQVGTNINLLRNTIHGANNAAVMVTQDQGPVGTMSISGNFIDNGACSINLAEKSYGPLHGVAITDNVFGGNTWNAHCAIIAPATTTALLTLGGDTYLSGATVTVSRG